jgi:hypothetical protein
MAAEEHLSQQFSEEMVPRAGNQYKDIPVSEYKGHYNRGWNTSKRMSDDGLGRADDRGEPDAWYDGYMDHAVDRPKGAHLEARRKGQSIEEWEKEKYGE